ncbi:MAG: sugar phosphate isomerase/epimerase [Akkermansiaceae bacterium]|nr:sugar phosphate isomerase/epimerase [Akkermansiaceae bacterium]
MKTSITVCQVPEAANGPFVLRAPLAEAFAMAANIGFDAVELFLPGPDTISIEEVKSLAATHGLAIAAVGTGAGMLQRGLTITDASPKIREAAINFIFSMIDFGGQLGAPAILGSMQGMRSHPAALNQLSDGLRRCGERAAAHGVTFIYEPLNRYETNLFNRLDDAVEFLEQHKLENVFLLADLFHMNIEERDIPTAIRKAGKHIGHVHFADSNRQAMGYGHTPAVPVMDALFEIQYSGYLSAEIFPLPDPESAARQTITTIRALS